MSNSYRKMGAGSLVLVFFLAMFRASRGSIDVLTVNKSLRCDRLLMGSRRSPKHRLREYRRSCLLAFEQRGALALVKRGVRTMCHVFLNVCAVWVCILAAGPAHGTPEQLVEEVLKHPPVADAMEQVDGADAHAVATLIELASIVSPSGRELERATAVAHRMLKMGLSDVEVDKTPNAVGVLPGSSGRAVVFVTMLDDLPIIETFQREGLRPRREGDRVVGPATEIQSAVAAMLIAAEALVSSGVRTRHDLVFAAVAREETGLQGMEALYSEYKDRAIGFVEVLGDGRAVHYGAGGAVAWWRVVAHGPAGHTGSGGLPNVNQSIAHAVSEIFTLPQPRENKDTNTVINIGIIRSGEVFNHKPATGWFSLDVRSQERTVVEAIARDIQQILERVGKATSTKLEMVPDIQSLGGQIPGARDSFLTQSAVAVSRQLGFRPEMSDQGCCNMRVPISAGSLAVGIKGERGGARATRDEWASIPAMLNMARHIVLLGSIVGEIQ